MDLPTVSVVLPTRERPGFLLEAARSVLAQRRPAGELLVVADGSVWDVEEVLRPLSRRSAVPIRVLEGSGRGPGAARNVGLRAAVGELVAFLDDDDVWLPEKLEWQAKLAWQTKLAGAARRFGGRSRLGVVGTECVRTMDPWALRWWRVKEPRRLRRISRRGLVRANRLVTSSVVVRRECFEECGEFDESLELAQDWDMWLRIAARWEVGLVPARLTIYRCHGDQRSGNGGAMRAWEAEVVGRALRRGGLGGRWLRGVARRRLAWAHCRLGRLLAREGDRERALRELKQSLSLFPYQPMVWGGLARCAFGGHAQAGAEPS